jgi:hypothetical protein
MNCCAARIKLIALQNPAIFAGFEIAARELGQEFDGNFTTLDAAATYASCGPIRAPSPLADT